MNNIFEKFQMSGEGIMEIDPTELNAKKSEVEIIDVRRPDEWNGELGHIPGAKFFTLGPDLTAAMENFDAKKTYVFVCRSGGRSGTATAQAQSRGLKTVFNMQGGMLLWNAKGLPLGSPS